MDFSLRPDAAALELDLVSVIPATRLSIKFCSIIDRSPRQALILDLESDRVSVFPGATQSLMKLFQ
jgi:hypothetical protein